MLTFHSTPTTHLEPREEMFRVRSGSDVLIQSRSARGAHKDFITQLISLRETAVGKRDSTNCRKMNSSAFTLALIERVHAFSET